MYMYVNGICMCMCVITFSLLISPPFKITECTPSLIPPGYEFEVLLPGLPSVQAVGHRWKQVAHQSEYQAVVGEVGELECVYGRDQHFGSPDA